MYVKHSRLRSPLRWPVIFQLSLPLTGREVAPVRRTPLGFYCNDLTNHHVIIQYSSSYLAGRHVGDRAMGLNCFQLIKAPVQLLKCFSRFLDIVLVCKSN